MAEQFDIPAGPDKVTPDPDKLEGQSDNIDADMQGPILEQLSMEEELWPGGPTRANVEEMKKKYPNSDVRASLMANETGVIWRTLNRAEWREMNNIVRNIPDEAKKEEVLFQKIVLFPDCSGPDAIDKLPAGILPAIMQEFYLYSGFQTVAESIKL